MTAAKAPTPIAEVQAIDVHAHVGPYRGRTRSLVDRFCSSTASVVLRRARLARIRWTMVSSFRALLPRGKGQVIAGNKYAARVASSSDGLLFWAVLDPLTPDSYSQVADMLALPKCVGIKVHPEEHVYPIRRRGKAIFEFAAKHGVIVLTHSGERNSMPEDFVKWADEFPEVRLILGHLGYGWDESPIHQVRAIQRSRHGNVFVDTSSSMNVMPGLIEWAVKEIGAARILFGTDSSCYFTPMQRARIDFADIRDSQKRRILCKNAQALFHID